MPSLNYNHNSFFNMSATDFLCQTYLVPCTSVRGHPRSNPDNQGTPAQLQVKQYIPLDNVEPRPGDVTIIAAHASGLPKELYESLWNELLQISRHKSSSFRIRSIWIADAATSNVNNGAMNHNGSNNEAAGDEHAHHLLQLIDHFRCLMPPPLVGIGHSTGAHNILQLAQLQPPLFTTIVAIEPIPTSDLNFLRFNTGPAHLSRSRASLEQAALLNHWSTTNTPNHTPSPTLTPDSSLTDPMMMAWTPTSAPAPLPKKASRSNSSAAGKIPTTAADESELAALARTVNYYPQALQSGGMAATGGMAPASPPLTDSTSTPPQQPQGDGQLLTPDALATSSSFAGLPFLAPGCLYIDGNRSAFWTASRNGRAVKLEHTGTGMGGSGGRVEGRVKSAVVEGSHFAPLENPRAVAGLTGMWLEEELGRWRERQREWEQHHVDEEMECGMVDQERMPAAGSKEAREWLQRFRGKNGKREVGRKTMVGKREGATATGQGQGREQDWKITSTPWCPGFEY